MARARAYPFTDDRSFDEAMRQEGHLQQVSTVAYKAARDSQRSKLYYAEDRTILHVDQWGTKEQKDIRFRQFSSIQAFVDSTRKTDLVKGFGDDLPFEEIFVKRRPTGTRDARCLSYSNFSVLELPHAAWSMRQFIVVHELAHHYSKIAIESEGGHGPLFATRLVELVGEFISGETADLYLKTFQVDGVKMKSEFI
jgi:putative metallohydrolase (TIGR04338 family)